nr:L-serine ammonia-lyase, iron-sulfur-dependent, subunit alpha [Streptomyces sp. AgN23]
MRHLGCIAHRGAPWWPRCPSASRCMGVAIGPRGPQAHDQYWQERVNFIALAVHEENASGGRVVTAPTNGAAGIIPAIPFYALNYTAAGKGADDDSRNDIAERFLLTATAVGSLCKANVSISGADVGCQGEVGSASAMAAAGLTERSSVARHARWRTPPRSRWNTISG